MKLGYLFLFGAILLLMQSCEIYFFPCVSEKHPDQIETKLMPVKTGNKWSYTISYYEKGKVASTKEMTLEIAGLDSVYYKDTDLHKHGLLIYRFKTNGRMNTRYGYLKCDDGVAYVKEYGYSPRELESGRTYPNEIHAGWKDPRDNEIEWSGTEKVTVPAGTFECWACEYYDKEDPKILIREYYSKGVGLVKSQFMNWKRTIQSTNELTSYSVN
jgi:hypothetical protein